MHPSAAHPRADKEQLGLALAAGIANHGADRADVLVFLADGLAEVPDSGARPLLFCARVRGASGGCDRILHRAVSAHDRLADVVALCALPVPRARKLAANPQPQGTGERGDPKEVLFLSYNGSMIKLVDALQSIDEYFYYRTWYNIIDCFLKQISCIIKYQIAEELL